MLNLYNLPNNNNVIKNGQDPVDSANKKADFTQYVDPNNELSHKNIKWGVWFAKSRVLLYRLLIAFLILLVVIFWGISLYKWGIYLWDWPVQKQIYAQIAQSENYNNINKKIQALPLQISGIQIYSSGVKKQDIIAEVYNPNKNFIIYFSYYFTAGGNKTELQNTFILPLQSRPVPVLGVNDTVSLSSPRFVMENVSWKRVDPHKIFNVDSFQKEHLNFTVASSGFVQAYAADKEKANAHVISFKLKNNSPYDYKAAMYYAGLYQGGSFVGVIPMYLDTFKSLETKDIDLRSFQSNLSVDQVKIFPVINIYDKEVYLELKK